KNINKDFFDDGTMSFFWRAHRISALIIFILVLLYVTLYDDATNNSDYNTKRGIIAVIISFVVFGVTITPDGPFRRPHPALWRLMLVLSIVYELLLIFVLFQTADDARLLLRHIDPGLGVPLPEKSYGGNCELYDSSRPDNPFHNVKDKMDSFVAVHFFGWWTKTLIVRDWWLCTVTSILFEVLEYTLEHQLPNFSECWWDHWLMDALICNGLGIVLGMKTVKYLSMKTYHWRGLWTYPTYRGKFSRILKQFTPYIYTDFDWRPTQSLKRWLSMLLIVAGILICELNAFTLKFVLWVPPSHFLCLARLVLFIFWGAVSLREVFQFLDDPQCHKFGAQSTLAIAIMITEVLIAFKFDWNTFTKPLPPHVINMLLIGALALIVWTLWHFYFQ
ncbi:hypothetical protein HELRODRAFT_150062, partial [Helobdella robusta]|uniref:Phosphatidylserine synthase n=1 Tax=Helobdella robusta TaxID=6412 RepID=T1EKE2_HELRO